VAQKGFEQIQSARDRLNAAIMLQRWIVIAEGLRHSHFEH
jgi:hypothetical protein